MLLHSEKHNHLISAWLSILFVFGGVLLVLYFGKPSEIENQLMFGLSAARLLVGGVFAGLLVFTGLAVFLSRRHPGRLQEILNQTIHSKDRLFFLLIVIYAVSLVLGSLFALSVLPVAKQFESTIGILTQLNGLILWLFVSSIVLFSLIFHLYRDKMSGVFSPIKFLFMLWMFLGVYIALVDYYRKAAYLSHLAHFEIPLVWLGFFYLLWALVNSIKLNFPGKERLNRFLLLAGIFFTVLALYTHLADWVDWIHKNRFEYWDSLARQFLDGKLYLADGSVSNFTTHDLTLHNGKWYVPIPPLPAILLLPVMIFAAPENVFMGDVSMILGALNATLVFLILERLAARKWISISRFAILLLVALFSFGTNHLWVSIMGEVWFVSQVVTVMFLALAILAALTEASPWLVGALLGSAILARPNSLMIWAFAFAIAMQIKRENGNTVSWKQWWDWSIRSAFPIGLAILGLFSYNYARFENFLDFGYVTISGDPEIVNNAQRYGIFSPRYILHNLEVMFLYLPQIQPGEVWKFKPSMEGMSMFLSTPILVYLFRRYENKWWIWGAWTSILLGFFLLVLYHNTGSAQFGYRYILDLILPIMALFALSLQKKQTWLYYVLFLLSIVINIYGTAWFAHAG